MTNQELADLLFPNIKLTPDDLEHRFPQRDLSEHAKVTRIGPSPTGFIHLGNLYNAIIAEKLAHQSSGQFYLRIEDTDNKREIKGAVDIIISGLQYFGIYFDEGAVIDGDNGNYGPYRQRQRREIYHVYAKYLVEKGLAYPCFCSDNDLAEKRAIQMSSKLNIGYYGEWAVCRNLSFDDMKQKIQSHSPYVLRFKAMNENNRTISVKDAIRGELRMPENILDFVLLKSDGIPTYHFAHVIDDHLMRTTHVIRGEEWISSLPLHVQLFDIFQWKQPIYCHTATLMKMDGNSRRKLSKRKDPELALSYYQEEGYVQEALWNYLLTILNSNYEDWKSQNPESTYNDFILTLDKMSNSGALFDLDKLNDISKDVISQMTGDEIYLKWLDWAKQWNPPYAKVLLKDKSTAIHALNIGRNCEKVRKDLVTWKQTCQFMSIYFDEFFIMDEPFPTNIDENDRKQFLNLYLQELNFTDDKTTWFEKVRTITIQMGYAANMKDFKKNPDAYKGSIVDLTNILRIAITGRSNAPDIWEVSNVLGKSCVISRIEHCL